ncbi:hypothetical protein AYI68_g2488 [Smittium mucronatum]|uniref:Uncharacterized protein n=1 Tax=Smittium mucronatum TaxID=133383 RepID=A0A1R0H2N0_9FUNG|nr:hypothetical protein AYI68_g2488 [Smittium mucronatum]
MIDSRRKLNPQNNRDPFAEDSQTEIDFEEKMAIIVKEEWLNFQKTRREADLDIPDDPDFFADIEREMVQENFNNFQEGNLEEVEFEEIDFEQQMAAEHEKYEMDLLAYEMEKLLNFIP